jgi:hypothetical protein
MNKDELKYNKERERDHIEFIIVAILLLFAVGLVWFLVFYGYNLIVCGIDCPWEDVAREPFATWMYQLSRMFKGW